jgi:hypothetical protein
MKFQRRNDPLLEAVREIQEYCEMHRLNVFSGYLTREHETVAVWNVARSRDWKAFLDVAASRGVGLIYLDWVTFDEHHVDEALVRGDETHEATEADPQVDEYNRELEGFRTHAGLTGVIEIAFSLGGVWHVFEWQAEWFAEFERCVDAWDEGAVHPRRLPRARLHDLANQLVNHPKYQVCQSKAQRRYLLEQLLGREFESVRASDVTGVLDRAEAIFELEIKPLERSYLKQRARELKAQGLSIDAIAGSLGVSRAAAKGLLAG